MIILFFDIYSSPNQHISMISEW